MNYNCDTLSSHGDIKISYYLFGSDICVGRQEVTDITDKPTVSIFNPLNTELNPTCHLLALLGSQHILHVSRIRVNLEAGCINFVGILVIIHQDARLYRPEDGSFNTNRNENLIFHIVFVTQL